jgi:hypothetical protein
MRKIILLVLFIPMLMAAALLPDFSSITRALGKGDAVELSKFFDTKIDLTILENENTYDKAGATSELRKFFTGNAVSSFQLKHQGVSPDKVSHYGIGELVAGAKPYRVFLYLKEVNNQYVIQELRLEKKA